MPTPNFFLVQGVFFFLVMCIACFLGGKSQNSKQNHLLMANICLVCSAVILVSLFEMVRKFPAQYYSAILTGQALCGVVSALIQILTISVTDVPIYGGFIFFGIGKCQPLVNTSYQCSIIGNIFT